MESSSRSRSCTLESIALYRSLRRRQVVPGQVVSAVQAGSLVFTPESDAHGTDYDSFTFAVTDDGGVSSGGQNTDPLPNTLSISVTNVNDAPDGMDATVVTSEDSSYFFSAADFGFTDIDGDALQSVVIQNLPANGTLLHAGTQVVTGQAIAAAQIGQLAFVPQPGVSSIAYDSFDFVLQDDGGTAGGGVDTGQVLRTITIDVSAVNDPPSGTDVTAVTLEETPYTFSIADFGFTDTDNHQFQSVIIDSLPATGELQLAGLPVTAGQSINVGLLNELIYVPAADVSGQAIDSFRHRVVDDGGTAASGQDVAAQDNTWTVNITGINDAPGAAGGNITAVEETAYQFAADDFGFTDTDGDSLNAVVITSLPVDGQLFFAGNPVTTGLSISALELTDLVYLPDVDKNGVDSFTFAVQDDGGTLNGGVNISGPDNALNIDVQSVNDSPEVLLTDAVFDEGSQNVFDEQFVTALDPDDDVADLQFVLTGNPQNGQLLLDGTPLNTGATFSFAQLSSGDVVYLHDGSETSSDTINFTLQDGGEDGVLPVAGQFNITITDITDPAPDLTDDHISVKFGQAGQDRLSDGSTRVTVNDTFNSPDDHTIALVDPPQHGVVTFNSDGTFVYDHDGTQNFTDSFTYSVTNIDNVRALATVNITVEPQIGAFTAPVSPGVDSVVVEEVVPEPEATEVVEAVEEVVEELQEETVAEETLEELPTDEFLPEETGIDFEAGSISGFVDSESAGNTTVVQTETAVLSGLTSRVSDRSGSNTDIILHNALEEISFTQYGTDIRAGLVVELDLRATELREVTDNNYFRDALANVDRDLQEADGDLANRYEVGTEALFGVSLSATAGALVWALRGGALLASVVAVTPLWSSIDPIKVVGDVDDEDEEPADEVEKVFE